MNEEPEIVTVSDWQAEVQRAMADMGCTCGAVGEIEVGSISNLPYDVTHMHLGITFYFEHAPACKVAQMPTMKLN